jgi:prepilin-type processing-associated H-X9-DG protein
MRLTRKDVVLILGCVVFLLATLGAIGSSGRRRAKEAICLSNLRQWGKAFGMFAEDNEGSFMRGWRTAAPNTGIKHTDYWMEALRAYYENPDLRCCPEASIPGTALGYGQYGGWGTFVGWGIFPGECGEPSTSWAAVTACDYGSYGNNSYICNPPPDAGSHIQGHPVAWNWRTVNVGGADEIPLLLDSQWIDMWPHHTDPPPDYDGMPWGTDHSTGMYRICVNRHDGSVNSVFLDGSARKVGLKELWRLKWHRQYNVGYPPPDWPEWMQDFEDY